MPYDIVGYRDIVGGDLATLLSGAEVAAATPAQNEAIANQLRARNAHMVVDRPPTKSRRYAMGFGPQTIAAGATALITAQPQVAFRGERFTVPSDFAGAVSINDIKVGKNSQLPTSNALPGRAFTEFAVGNEVSFDTAEISQQVSLSITNTSLASISFTAMLMGTAVE